MDVKQFVDAIKQKDTTPKNRTHQATVSKIDNEGVVWVRIAGSDIETPTAAASSEVKHGDSINVEWRNNKLYIAGNYTNPSAGVERVVVVEQKANTALEDSGIAHSAAVSATESAAIAGRAASVAQTAAEAAQATANSKKRVFTSQPVPPYSVGDLWVDTSGGVQNGDSLGYGSDAYSALVGTGQVGYMVVGGVSAESESVVYVCTFARSANESYNASDWQLAATDDGAVDELREWFWHDANGAHVLGDVSGYRNDLTSTGMKIVDTSTETVIVQFGTETSIKTTDGTELVHFGYATGTAESGTAIAPYYSLGTRVLNSTVGNYSTAEGKDLISSGYAAHAEGGSATASGMASHAEGAGTTASNYVAHAEGWGSTASGEESHAEGRGTTASGEGSHAEGWLTKASSDYQHVSGKFNIEDSADTYAVIVGNGTANNARSNALTVDWSGNVAAAGALTVGGHSSAVGTVLSSVWTASNSSASGTNCTAEITLTPGTWMLGMITPTCSTSIAYYFSNISSTLKYPYFNMGTGGSGWVPVVITSSTSTRIKTGSSTSVTYSNTDRGQIFAVRIA